jgi:hypothetical protein
MVAKVRTKMLFLKYRTATTLRAARGYGAPLSHEVEMIIETALMG